MLGLTLFMWLALWAVFKRPAWFHWLLLPAFLAVPMEAYLHFHYKQGISPHHLGIIMETSPQETLEFLGNSLWLALAALAAVMAWWWLCWRAAWRTTDLDWSGKSRWIFLAILAAVSCTWLYQGKHGGQSVAVARPFGSGNAQVSKVEAGKAGAATFLGSWSNSLRFPSLPAWAKVSFELDTLGETRPFGLALLAHDFWRERQYLAELARKSKRFTFGAHQPLQDQVPQVVVMVIGESSRYDRWSLNGYGRETNPLLKKEANLVSLSNVVTAVSATRLSVPVLVSRKRATQSLHAGFSEKSFLSAFREAGFKTFWLSNQMSFGRFDTPVSVFAQEADVTQFLNLGGFIDNSSYDEVLLAPLRKAIADPARKKLIVLHTLGNHWNYSHRYPKEFDKWQPSLFGVENPAYTDAKLKPELNNSYDNSIMYTDWFLAQVIADLKESGTVAAMMYVSDHGQTLYDGSCKLAFHGHNTQYEFHVPAVVWYSELYRVTHPRKVRLLHRNRHARLATENVFHSLLDLADIRYGTEQLEWSFLNRQFREHKRYVDSYGWTDYDNARIKGDCREVIAKDKPLPQTR
ncbi:phosphoethanolamine transferase [Noviherbaspirillum massiliense]|uniref:phosphoethanolamine transferase n=1 Tax=Noviherbaspirillum massiliense TaxID=1465823 RepID=UPI001FE07C0B|nr:phosphoethanolamine transferase [Noviherbaspirillum massiliense]